jgi:hypothetical protein
MTKLALLERIRGRFRAHMCEGDRGVACALLLEANVQ